MGELATISHKFSFPPRRPSPLGRRLICWLPNWALKWNHLEVYFCKFYNLNLEMNLTIGHLKGWKSKIYVTTVLDSFQDRKGITLKVVNNKQVIGLYSTKYGRNKTKGARGRHALSPRKCVFLAPFHFWVHVTFMCLLRRPPRCHYFVLLSGLCHGTDFSAPFWLSFSGVVLVSRNESKVSSTGCTKNQWLQCSCRLTGPLQKYFYSRLLQTWFLLLLCKNYLFYKY